MVSNMQIDLQKLCQQFLDRSLKWKAFDSLYKEALRCYRCDLTDADTVRFLAIMENAFVAEGTERTPFEFFNYERWHRYDERYDPYEPNWLTRVDTSVLVPRTFADLVAHPKEKIRLAGQDIYKMAKTGKLPPTKVLWSLKRN